MLTLIDRLSKLGGPDRQIEEEIHNLLCPGKFFSQLADAPLGAGCWMYDFPNGDVSSALHVTSSVDAVIALAERVLPGWKWGIHHHRGLIRAYVSKTSPLRPMPIIADHSDPAIALCIAILRAKEASNGE